MMFKRHTVLDIEAHMSTPTFHPENCRLNLELFFKVELRTEGGFCMKGSCKDRSGAKETLDRCLRCGAFQIEVHRESR